MPTRSEIYFDHATTPQQLFIMWAPYASSYHTKLLVLAPTLVFIWLLFITFNSDHHQILPTAFWIYGKSSCLDLLPLAEARDFCYTMRRPVHLCRHDRRMIYDLFLVNTELEWLKILMGQINDQVDYFAIVEASRTSRIPRSHYSCARTGSGSRGIIPR